jgi:hypothetical protein
MHCCLCSHVLQKSWKTQAKDNTSATTQGVYRQSTTHSHRLYVKLDSTVTEGVQLQLSSGSSVTPRDNHRLTEMNPRLQSTSAARVALSVDQSSNQTESNGKISVAAQPCHTVMGAAAAPWAMP